MDSTDLRVESLLKQIAADFKQTEHLTGCAFLKQDIANALHQVPRHEFVPASSRDCAYINAPLPIGKGQTISQPFIVALMTQLLNLKPTSRVLEIGTGCGYQSAVLAALVKTVYSIEIIPDLARKAKTRLAALGVLNVESKCDDGQLGWPEHSPFDAIMVTAAAATIPPALIEQLSVPGKMVIPVTCAPDREELMLVRKDEHGRLHTHSIIPVRFVPLTGGHR